MAHRERVGAGLGVRGTGRKGRMDPVETGEREVYVNWDTQK